MVLSSKRYFDTQYAYKADGIKRKVLPSMAALPSFDFVVTMILRIPSLTSRNFLSDLS